MNRQAVNPAGHRFSLFWRLWYRSVSVKRPQAGLALGSLLVGAALAATLMNLSSDVSRKMTEEFRSYGANVVVAPAASSGDSGGASLMNDDAMRQMTSLRERVPGLAYAPLLHAVMRLRRAPADPRLPDFENVVAVGTDFADLHRLYPGWRIEGKGTLAKAGECIVGAHVATKLYAEVGDTIQLEPEDSKNGEATAPFQSFSIAGVLSTGSSEDEQVFVPLITLQQLAGVPGQLSLIELQVPGEPTEVEGMMADISRSLPGVEARPVRSIVESQGKVMGTIRWLLISLTALILVIVALCVMATMTAIVLERKRDIAVMKALGAPDSLVMRLLMSEGAALGLLGGLTGFGVGLTVARLLGRELFDVALHPAWWTLPAVCLMTVALALAATIFPVRIARTVEPAVVLKGE